MLRNTMTMNRPQQSMGTRKTNGRPDSACIQTSKVTQGDLAYDMRGNGWMQDQNMNSVFEPETKDGNIYHYDIQEQTEFFDIESSTRKDVRTAAGNNRFKGIGAT